MKRPISLIILFFVISVAHAQIQTYENFIGEHIDTENDVKYIVLRRFKILNKSPFQYVAINPMTLTTKIISSNNVKKRSWNYLNDRYGKTTYMKTRHYAKTYENKERLDNAGFTNIKSENSFMMTTDLCPSSKPLEYEHYESIYKKMQHNQKLNIPIGIAVTGIWLERHEDDLQWLLNMEKNKLLSITWINHSYNHRYIREKPFNENFLLMENTNIEKEILDLEKLMIEKGLIPSIYFRFPGLISDKPLYNQILDYGLIPLGSDSWIAKNQFPKTGSIVLTHGNGNEHIGVVKFDQWLDSNKNKLHIKSINNSLIDYFENEK